MCIVSSVGKHCANLRKDVVVVQCALAYFWRGAPYRALPISGRCDAATIDAILDYQTRVQRMAKPDGRIAPRGDTLQSLFHHIPSAFDLFALRAIMVSAGWETVLRYHTHLLATMSTRAINTPLRRAHFLAQLGHESGSFRYTEELASGAAYEGRVKDLGNTENGDGVRFKGRGLIQLTGRRNYQDFGDAIGIDLTADGAWTQVATDPALAVDAAGWFWETKGLNALADNDDIKKVTRRINGGYNGLADRQQYLDRARWFLVYP